MSRTYGSVGTATDRAMYELARRTVVDVVFRRKILADPAAAALDAGLPLTEEQLGALSSVRGAGLGATLETMLQQAGEQVPRKARRADPGAANSLSGLHVIPRIDSGARGIQLRVALIFAPLAGCNRPPLGISLLKSALTRQGMRCDIHYLNLALAREIGARLCDLMALGVPPVLLLGDWLFAPALFGENGAADSAYVDQVLWGEARQIFTPAVVLELLRIRQRLPVFLQACLERVDWSQYDLVGFSTSYQQNCASLALARAIKISFPDTPIAFGGANCFGEAGRALLRLYPFVDFVCTGQGEVSLPVLVEALAGGEADPRIPGILARNGDERALHEPATTSDLDALPYPDYSDYVEQLQNADPSADYDVRIVMEASRGCWWAEKSPCTFCGQNGNLQVYRCKSPERALDELQYLFQHYGRKILFVDNVMPPSYLKTLMPQLAKLGRIPTGWEVKADLARDEVRLLSEAGVEWIQPGIESLSDPILRLMRKGTTVANNIQVLKWAKQFGLRVLWNLLCGFPCEDPAEYVKMAALIPLLTHLDPPKRVTHISIDRFSPYWATPARYGITRLEPLSAYNYVYHALSAGDRADLAYFFDAEYPDDSATYTQGVRQAAADWHASTGAALDVFPSAEGIRVVDTRQPAARQEYSFDGLAADLYLRCDAAQSVTALMEAAESKRRPHESEVAAILARFVEQGLMIRSGKQYLSLAVVCE